MNLWRRLRRAPVRQQGDGGPVLVGDTWMDARGRPAERGWLAAAAATWGRRLGIATRGLRRAGGWLVGVESRGVERRAITSLPWNAGGDSPSGGPVSAERAMRLAAMWGAARILSTNVASVPLRQYRETGGTRQKLPLAPLFQQPAAQGTLHDWIQRAVMSMVLHGNAVGYIVGRDYYGYPTQIEWLPPSWVSVVDTATYGPGSFTDPVWYVLGQRADPADIVHIPWMAVAGRVWGLSPMGAFARAVGTGLSAEEYTNTWFDSGGMPPGTFKNVNQKVDQNEAKIIKTRLVDAIKSRQPIVFGKDWDFNAITLPASEISFVETMRLSATQIATIYGVPPEQVGGETGGSMSYSSPQQREVELIQLSLVPLTSKLDEHLSRLLPRGQCVRFDTDKLVRLDPESRWSVYEKARLIGAMNVDEIREAENLPPLPDGQGADYTPLPLAAGVAVSPPTIRSEDGDRLRLIRKESG